MFTFVYQPKSNRETLREFNARLSEFCTEKPVVSIEATAFGPNLILQGTMADDMDADGVPTFIAIVRTLDPASPDLEEQIDGIIQQELIKHNPDSEDTDPNLPVRFIVAQGEKHAWLVLLCVNGVAEDDDDEEEGDPEPEPASPAAGFKAN